MIALTYQVADEYGVSGETMEKVIECESQYVADAYNASENSMGLVQIHHKSWPSITDEQRKDPQFSINFLAEKLKAGEGYLWSCFNALSSKSTPLDPQKEQAVSQE